MTRLCLRAIATLLLSVATLPAAEGRELADRGYAALGACKVPDSLDELKGWLDTVDSHEWTGMQKPVGDDHVTRYGTIVKASCFSGKRAARKKEIIERYEKAVARALAQAGRCFRAIGFGELTTVIPVLRSAAIDCKPFGKDSPMARAHPTKTGRKGHWLTPKLWSRTARYDRDYRIDFNTDQDNDLTLSEDDLSSLLFHETLHFAGIENQSWHDEIKTREFYGCDKSAFDDRVYFIQAACNPADKSWGGMFYNSAVGAFKCRSVCKEALTHFDKQVAKNYSYYYGGEAATARPYGKREAELTCNRIEANKKAYDAIRERQLALYRYNDKLDQLTWGAQMHKKPYPNELYLAARKAMSDAAYMMGRWKSLADTLAQVRRSRAEVERLVKENCAANPVSPGYEYACEHDGQPYRDVALRAERYVLSVDEGDVELVQFFER